MNFFAQTAPDSLVFAGWLSCLVAFLIGVNQALKFTDRLKSKPPGEQLESTQVHLAARLAQLETHFETHEERESKSRTDIYERMKTDTDRLNEKLGDVQSQVSRLEGNTELINQRMVQIDQKLDRLNERTRS